MRRVLPVLALILLSAAGGYALTDIQFTGPVTLVQSDAPTVEHETDHGTGIRSEWGLTISDPLFDADGKVVRAVSYDVRFFPAGTSDLVGYMTQLKIVQSDASEVVGTRLTVVPPDMPNDDDGILHFYRAAFQPAEGLTWGDVETVLDYTASVTYEPVALPSEVR